jgi:autotransporter-associated beta strand protein
LAASNVGGLTKLGAGTLTLSAAPLYTGWTTVKAGKLIVPAGTALDLVAGAGGEIEGATTNNLKFASGYTLTAGEESHVATGAADVSDLTVYIANPAAVGSFTVVKAGSVTGTATLAFPEGTSEKVKNRWSLKLVNGRLKASSISPFVITFL